MADGMDQRKVLLQEIVADDRLKRRAVAARECVSGVCKVGGAKIVRRRVDEIARERDTLGDAREFRAVDTLGELKLPAVRLSLAVAREPVRVEREGKAGEPDVMRRIREAIGACGQQAGQAP